MAIVKASGRVSMFDGDAKSPEMISADESDDDEEVSNSEDSDNESDLSDADSGMGSDEFDLSELGEANTEFCQVGNQSFSLPLELHGLHDLTSVLSLETWNDCLTEEERFGLSEFLPDLDQETLGWTLTELFAGKNFHFGSPVHDLFTKLRGGMLDPRVVLYRRGLSYFQKREHYHSLRKYQNSMVGGLVEIQDAWRNCPGYGIQEKLRLLNIVRSQRSLGYEENGDVGSETDSENSESSLDKRLKMDRRDLEAMNLGKDSGKGIMKVTPTKAFAKKDFEKNVKVSRELLARSQMRRGDDVDDEDDDDDAFVEQHRASLLKSAKKNEALLQNTRGMEHALPQYSSKSRISNQGVTVASYNPHSLETMSNAKYPAKDWMYHVKAPVMHQSQKGTQIGDLSFMSKKWKSGYESKSAKTLQGKFKGKSAYNGGIGVEYSRGGSMFTQSDDETESDSLEKLEEEENPYPGSVRTIYDPKKNRKLPKNSLEMGPYSTKGKYQSKTADSNYTEDIILVKKKTHVPEPSGKVQQPWKKLSAADRKRKGAVDLDQSSEPNSMHEYGSNMLDGNTDTEAERCGKSHMPLLGCNSATKKRKGNADVIKQDKAQESVYIQSQQIDGASFIKKRGKKKADAATVSAVVTPDTMIPEKDVADVEPEPKPQKKTFTLITPSKLTGFSFSIIHLLSAIRKAMITPHMEDTAVISNHLDKGEENKALQVVNGTGLPLSNDNMNANAPECAPQNNLPSLTVQEIVNRVRSNPGDPCILETQEPLHDLVRGVLKIFSSKTAPLGAKNWKAIVSYEKSNKSWSWVGPVSSSPSNSDPVEEETSPEAWGLPYKTLVKLVDSFANWLKSGQDILKQLGSLPPPPTALLSQLDEKERFKDLRAQKSLNTIGPSSAEVREYFRKEEQLRYSIPDRAFSYTALDGKKSIVPPLRRGGGKPTSKARDHFMLKPDRPPHITLLCVVRDAAARLPGSIGTRADVCTLIRDSQYIVEDVSDEKVNQVVSGALDRLHYERDPCVQFDVERKLWVYLHRDREEEDFEDDGTSSTKKWKRPRKDAADQTETGAGNDVSYPMIEGQAEVVSSGYDLNPDLNADISSLQAGTENVHVYNDLRSNMESIQSYVDPSSAGRGQGNSMSWEPMGLNPLSENPMLCQENSTSIDFDDEPFSRERHGLLSASLL